MCRFLSRYDKPNLIILEISVCECDYCLRTVRQTHLYIDNIEHPSHSQDQCLRITQQQNKSVVNPVLVSPSHTHIIHTRRWEAASTRLRHVTMSGADDMTTRTRPASATRSEQTTSGYWHTPVGKVQGRVSSGPACTGRQLSEAECEWPDTTSQHHAPHWPPWQSRQRPPAGVTIQRYSDTSRGHQLSDHGKQYTG